ncbi:MAG: hypothetical protein J5895_02660 [Alphaproteobacteria bacterium]|nr:hypothetical protein [Alphaproteobacteria bacterium]
MNDDGQKYPLLQSFSKPFSDVLDGFGLFLKYAVVFGVVFCGLAVLFKQTFLCSSKGMPAFLTCSHNISLYVLYLLIKTFLLAVFIKIWYDALFLKEPPTCANLSRKFKAFFKIFGGIIVFLGLNIVPAVSFTLLSIREPSTIWQREICYFLVVSIGFWAPFLLMRFYADFAALIEGVPLIKFSTLWQHTTLKTSKIVLSFVLVALAVLVIFVLSIGLLRSHISGNLVLYNLFAEFVCALVLLFITAVLVNFMKFQKDLFA